MSFVLGNQTIQEDSGESFFLPPPNTGLAPEPNRAIYKSVMFTLYSKTSLSRDQGIGIVRQAVVTSGTIWSESLFNELVSIGQDAKRTIPTLNPNNFASEAAFKSEMQKYIDNDPVYTAAWYSKLLSQYSVNSFTGFQAEYVKYHPE